MNSEVIMNASTEVVNNDRGCLRSHCIVPALLSLCLFGWNARADVTGDYRTAVAAATWSTASHWETYNGSAWVAASVKPGSANNVFVQSGHTVALSGNEACNDLHIS